MIYREIGKTNKKASIIGLGCEHLDFKPYEQVKSTIDAALEYGINIFDIFMPGKEVRENISKALGARRKDILIQGHICSSNVGQQYDISRDMLTVKRFFEDHLRLCGGFMDFGMLFFIDSDDDYKNVFETDIAGYALKLKEKGDIGHIGFSSHNPVTAIKAVNTGLPEIMLFSINPAFDIIPTGDSIFTHLDNGFKVESLTAVEPKRSELYRLCEQKNVGITVMKTLGAGKLISKEHTPFCKPLTVSQCIHYALSRPAVASALIGCKTPQELKEVVNYLDISDAERDYTEILSSVRGGLHGSCVYCNHCQPCLCEIDIATVNKYLDIAKLDTGNIPPSIRSHYQNLVHRGDECSECGSCESRCPFDVPIIENMKKADELLGKIN
ncbi:MAG: aldo/keto reductase [Treponema sp.]|jgi:predicted aldo/keto reductase-like oxidoreductase|nr:aldo/keto reductase [Treponema sp.]